jgi:aspartyl-tRNA(Asn)/glutamyl-tRNA(Gln) amidotransferase subunit B
MGPDHDTRAQEGYDELDIEALIDEAIKAWPTEFAYLRSGRAPHPGFLLGQVMKASGGKADPVEVQRALRARAQI